MAFVLPFFNNSGNTWVSKALLATERDIAQGKLRFLFTALGAIFGNSRWKQILLELSDSGSHCTVYTNVSAYSFRALSPRTVTSLSDILRRIIRNIFLNVCLRDYQKTEKSGSSLASAELKPAQGELKAALIDRPGAGNFVGAFIN